MNAQKADRSTAKELGLFALILFAALMLWHGGVIIGSQVFCGGDLVNQIIPMRMIQEKWGWFTGWDPYTFSGRPLMDDIQAGVFYPLNWLHLLGASIERTMSLLIILHLVIGAFGFFVFARARSGFAGATLAALVWTFGGFQVLKISAGIFVFTYAFAWVPWMWWAAERQSLTRGRGFIFCGLLGLFGAFQMSAGSPQPVQITWCGLALWTLGRLIRPREGENRRPIILGFGVAGLLAILACTPMLVGVMRFQSESFPRTSGDLFTYLSDGSIEWRLIWTWLFPDFFGPGSSEEMYWGSGVGFHETNMYMGIIPIMLAAFAVQAALMRRARGEDRRLVLSLVSLVLVGLLIALGSHGFLFEILVRIVPSFKFFRVPARWLLWTVAALAILAARGLDELLAARDEEGKRRVQIEWIGCAAAFVALCTIVRITAVGLLKTLGLSRALEPVPPAILVEHRDQLVAFATGSITWTFLMAAVAGGIGVFMLRGIRRRALVVVLLLCCTADLYRFWLPFTDVIPDEATPPQIETETPYHLISSKHFRDYFYPKTELMQALEKDAAQGRVHYDDLIPSYTYDQNQRELLNQRPIASGIYITRGYQQLHLGSYVTDYYSSIVSPKDGKIGAFLNATEMRDREFLDAYNVTRFLTYPYPELEKNYEKIGLEREGPLGSFGLVSWRNPHARGWVWLSSSKGFLDSEPDARLGSVDSLNRTPDHWTGKVTTTAPCYIHFSEPEYSNWTIGATDGAGKSAYYDSDGSLSLTTAGTWTFERTYQRMEFSGLFGTGFAMLIAAVMIIAGVFRSRREASSIQANEPAPVSL